MRFYCKSNERWLEQADSPFSRKLDFWKSGLTIAIFFLVDSYVFFATWTALTICFVDFDLFLLVLGTIFAVGKRCREGRVSFFVTLPSNARRWRKVGLSFYLDSSGFGGSLVTVRGREKADRNRDLGVKVQIAGVEESLLECLSNREAIRKEDKKDSCFGGLRGKAEGDGLPAPRFYLSMQLTDQ